MDLKNGFYRDLPYWKKVYDYGARPDGQPVYRGYATLDSETDSITWIMFFSKYNDANYLTEEYCLEGAWDDRVALFAEYAV